MVTDDQIDMMCSGGRDHAFEWALALSGAGLGMSDDLLALFVSIANGASPSLKTGLFAVLSIACLAAGAAKYTEHMRNMRAVSKLVDSIRRGRRVSLGDKTGG